MSYSLDNDLDMLGMDDDLDPRQSTIMLIKIKQKGETKMSYRESMVKLSMVKSLQDYVDNGVKKGGFLTAVLSNNLKMAARYADDENFETLAHITSWCCNNIPEAAWGSKKKYDRWIRAHQCIRDEKGYGNYPIADVFIELNKIEIIRMESENG